MRHGLPRLLWWPSARAAAAFERCSEARNRNGGRFAGRDRSRRLTRISNESPRARHSAGSAQSTTESYDGKHRFVDGPGRFFDSSPLEIRTMRQVTWRLLPFLMICYFVSFVDRVNVGFAALQMVKALHMSPACSVSAAAFFSFPISCLKFPATCCSRKSAPESGSRAS